jgi:hypothetical protein
MSGRAMSANYIHSSLRAQRSNPEGMWKSWIASSLTLLAMTALMQFNRAILKS